MNREQQKTLVLSSLGGVLEFFDFIIYIFLVPYIERIFFPGDNSTLTTLKTLAVFSVGYLIRPLGGILFSHFGDRFGRKAVFLLTVLFMAAPSFAIGLLPPPSSIGVMAPILLVVFRMFQGLALGGEIPAAITFISEHMPSNRQGIAMAVLFIGINMGLMLGSLTAYLLTHFYSEEDILAYAWRIPFLLGGAFGFLSILLRRHLKETKAFLNLQYSKRASIPFVELIKHHRNSVAKSCALVTLPALCVFMYLYWPQYLHKYMHYDYSQLMCLNTASTIFLSISIAAGGILADRLGYRRVYTLSALTIFIMAYPLYRLFASHDFVVLTIAYALFTFFFGLFPSCYGTLIPRQFPTEVRYSGVALSYNLSYAIVGGLSPTLCTLLIHWFGSPLAPAFYLMAMAVIPLWSMKNSASSGIFERTESFEPISE